MLRVVAAFDRLPRLGAFRGRLFGSGEDLLALVGRLAGAEPGDGGAARAAVGPGDARPALRGGGDCHGGGRDVGVDWRFARCSTRASPSPAS